MTRNRSEQVPYPELSAAIHAYYKTRAFAGGMTITTQNLWKRLPEKDRHWLRNNWSASTTPHDALMNYYHRLAKPDAAQ